MADPSPSTDVLVPSGGMFRRGNSPRAAEIVAMDAYVEDHEALRSHLLTVFNAEHSAVLEAAHTVIEHMIRAGEALCAIRDTFPPRGGWQDWLREHVHVSQGTVHLYMRFARYQQLLRDGGAVDVLSARRVLDGLPKTSWSNQTVIAEARRLKREGWTLKAIAEHMGHTPRTISRWVNPEQEQRRRNRRQRFTQAGRRAALKAQREAVIKRKGGQTQAAYGYVRKALDALQHAGENEGDVEAKRHLQTAMNRLYAAEDELVKASKLGKKRDVVEGGEHG